MPTKIGHASQDENKRAKGGVAGDQSGKEVYIRQWYSSNWKYLIRCKDPIKSELMARSCEIGCANDFIGYDQNQRNTLNSQAKLVGYDLSKVKVPCETDCSAFMSVCAQCAGINIPYHSGNAPTTSTMLADFMSTGAFVYYSDSKYLTSDKYLRRGDILVSPGHHTLMILEDGIAETGAIYPTIKLGNTGKYVEMLQSRLVARGYKLEVDGDFGPNTKMAVISFQGEKGLVKDGIVGRKTWEALS